MIPTDLKRIVLSVAIGGTLGFAYQKLVGCRTGACPLTATPVRTVIYGAVLGLIFSLTGCSRREAADTRSKRLESSSKESSMSGSVIHLTSGAFESVKAKAQDRPILIDFWAPWCGPCRMQGPILDQVATQMGDRAIVAKVNVDEERELAAPFGVQAIPTLVILKNGKITQRFVGVQQADALVKALEQ